MFCMDGEISKSRRNDNTGFGAVRIRPEQRDHRLQQSIHIIYQNTSQSANHESNEKTHWDALDAYNFKRQQTMKNIVLRMPQTQESRKKFIDYCRSHFQHDELELKRIDEFEKSYESPHHAVKWYTANSFVFRTVNQAFRIQDPEFIEKCHFFIIDLSKSLRQGLDQLVETFSALEEKKLILYRGHRFSFEEYNRFCSSYGYIAFNSYLSTSSDINVAKMFAGFDDDQVSSSTDCIQVLFHIEVDLNVTGNSNVIVADISEISWFKDECEYLFDIGATFQVVNKDYTNRIIKLSATDKTYHVAQSQLSDSTTRLFASQRTIDLIPTAGMPNDFSESLLQIDKGLNIIDAFEEYILETSIDDKNYQAACDYCVKARILPRTDPTSLYARECRKLYLDLPFDDEYTDTYVKALEHFLVFYIYAPNELIEWAIRALGFTYYKIVNYTQSEAYFTDALKISTIPINIATCYYFLGCIYGELEDHEKSKDYFNLVLQLENHIQPLFTAATYYQIAFLYADPSTKENYLLKALSIYQIFNKQLFILKCRSQLINLNLRASKEDFVEILDLYFEYCVDHHMKLSDIIDLYKNIAFEYYDYLNYDRALEYYEKIIPYLSDDESHHKIIADIYIKKRDSISAIQYLEKTLYSTKDPEKIVSYGLLIGLEYFKQKNFDMALKWLERSASECDQCRYDSKSADYLFGWELQCKSEIRTCLSLDRNKYPPSKLLYFYSKVLTKAVDFIGLFKSDIIDLFKLIDNVYQSNNNEEIAQLLKANYKNNESHLAKLIYETIIDNYIFLGDHCDTKNIFYYVKALDIYNCTDDTTIGPEMKSICISKINHICKTNFSDDVWVHRIEMLFPSACSTIETQDEQNLFKKYCQIELKNNRLAIIHSSLGDIHMKQASYERANLLYHKSLIYYETFPALFHLDIADLYSKQGDAIYKQGKEEQIQNDNDQAMNTTIVEHLFEKAIAIIVKYDQKT